MPIARFPTPPQVVEKTNLTVLESLNAWTSNEDFDEDQKKPRKVPLGYTPLCQNEQGPTTGWRTFFDSESDSFNAVVGVVIIVNAVIIGCETDMGTANFVIAEHIFNTIFFLEMLIRISQLGLEYFKDPWYLFDCTLVLGGSLDLWIIPLIMGDNENGAGAHELMVFRLLRMLRLCRVLRVVRLFRMFNNLLLIVKAFGKALQVVVLISLITVITIYSLSIVLTQLIGHQSHKFREEDQVAIKKWFGTIPNSMSTLFWVMFGSSWDELWEVLSHQYPKGFILCMFALYMVLTVSLASLIVGLISQSLIIAQEEFKARKMASFNNKKKILAAELKSELNDIHEEEVDQGGTLNARQLKQTIKADSGLLQKLAAVGVDADADGLMMLVDTLSNEEKERISIDHFIEKLINLSGQSQASAVVDIKYEIMKNRERMNNLDEILNKIQAKYCK
jgi:voltage-gated sodium channel